MSIDPISPKDYDFVSTKLREFFKQKGFTEVCAQHRLSILSACEDPESVTSFEYCGKTYPMKQTNQMELEEELLTGDIDKLFCFTTSYRQEPNPIEGRHNLIFPMFEFEFTGDMKDLENLEAELLVFLGYPTMNSEVRSKLTNPNISNKDGFYVGKEYNDLCQEYKTNEITHEHETKLYQDYGPVVFLRNFPEHTSPFFNMKRNTENKTANKIDVILSGMETIGSAERSCDVEDMRKRFYTISNGNYAKTLFSRFGKDRVEAELNKFLSLKFKSRVGAGCGITRLISSLKKEKLMK